MFTYRIVTVVLVIFPVCAASGATVTLSSHSSDPTPASILDATMEFAISDLVEMTLTVTNYTTAPFEFDINEVFFNAKSNVTGLTLDSVTSSLDGPIGGWSLVTSSGTMGPTHADGFGIFDYGVIDGVSGPDQIQPAESVAFVFTITGTGPYVDTDFIELSQLDGGGDIVTYGAAKFVNGPGDDSAYGAYVPEPGTLSLLFLGGFAFARRRR
jgi:hypothetical protein